MKHVTIFRPAPGYKQKPYSQVVGYPDSGTLFYDANQSCLTVKLPGGEPIAAFRCFSFRVDDQIEMGEPSEYAPLGDGGGL